MVKEGLNIKYILLWSVFYFVLIVFFFSQVSSNKLIDISVEKMGENLSMYIEGEIQKDGQMLFKKRYSLSPEEYESVVYYGPVSNMNVEEILLVKVQSSSQIRELKVAMENRIKDQIRNFDGYGTDQLPLLKNARIIFRGEYGLLIIAKNADELADLYERLIKEGAQ